jgi:predicted transcriptional regulator
MFYPNGKNSEILKLNSRKKIYEVVKKHAGSHFLEIVRQSNLSKGTASYHLGYLVKEGLIIKSNKGNNTIYFPKEFKPEHHKLLILLRQKSIRDILLFILTNKDCGHGDIVKFVKLSPSTVTWHLNKLEEEKIISSINNGRTKNYRLLIDSKEVINLLITYKESFLDSTVNNILEMLDS